MRNDDSFDQFYTTAIKSADGHTGEPSLPRYRKPPRRLDEGSEPHQFSTPKEYYRYHYYYCVDLLIGEISERLAQDSLTIPMELEKLLMFAANNEDNSEITISEVVKTYSQDFNAEKLKIQLQMLPDLVKTYRESQNLNRLVVTKISTILDIFIKVPGARELFSEIDKTCTAERSFSVLHRVKTYLRSTVSEERLNSVILLHIHKDKTDSLNLTKVATLFVSANSRRIDFFGKFV